METTNNKENVASEATNNKKLPLKKLLKIGAWILALAGIAWVVAYSVEQYNAQNAAEGILICNEGECFKTIHIHSDIEFDLCGESYTLPRETGPLDGLHTHKEKNYLHFHEKVDVDAETLENLYHESLSAQEVLDIFELEPSDYCESDNVRIYVTVNGEEPEEGLEYNWVDGDDIVIYFEEE